MFLKYASVIDRITKNNPKRYINLKCSKVLGELISNDDKKYDEIG